MKKILIATGIAALAFVSVAAAQGYTFSTNLTVGSTGADVVALQTWLMANGYSIPSVASGAATKGYFGSQTKTAVVAYQTAVGLPSTGFVGPLTRAKLNAGGTAGVPSGTTAVTCPAGYVCTPQTPAAPVVCPAGNVCTPTTPGTPAAPVGITTPGVAGSLDVSNGSFVGNGSTVNDGQSVDMASYALQSGASDMAVSSIAFDFNVRPWLYMTTLTLKDSTGKTLSTLSGLSQSNFTEITVGSDYRLTIPASFVVPKATRYIVILNGTFGSSNRGQVPNFGLSYVQVRSVDGTGVTLTSTYGNQNVTPTLYVYYAGLNNSNLIVTIDPNSPNQNIVQTNTGTAQTQNVLMGVYDIKSQNVDSTLQSLIIGVHVSSGFVGTTFANIQLKSGSTLLNSGVFDGNLNSSSTSMVTFNNFNLALPSNVYVPVSVYATIQPNINGINASTSLTAYGAETSSVTATIGGIDSSSNPLKVNSPGVSILSSDQTFTVSAGSASNETWSIATPGVTSNSTSKITTFNGSFSLTAGSNPLYISTAPATALTLASNYAASSTVKVSSFVPSNGTQSYDNVAGFYTINPGSTRAFTVNGTLQNNYTSSLSLGTGITAIMFTDTATSPTKYNVNFNLTGLNSDFHQQVLLGVN